MSMKIARPFLVASLALVAACATDVTPPSDTGLEARHDLEAVTQSVTLSGPTEITTSGNYTYYANATGVSPTFRWYTRTCSGLTVSGCTVAWSIAGSGTLVSSNMSSLTRALTVYPCSLRPAGPTFQVRVEAQAWQSPVVHDTLVTRLRRVCQ
jgi:hypothetical protein